MSRKSPPAVPVVDLPHTKTYRGRFIDTLPATQSDAQGLPLPPAAPEFDTVQRPSHYNQGGIECLDAIEAALTKEEFRGYCKGNALKYVWRERFKNGDQDLAKAVFYLQRLLKEKK